MPSEILNTVYESVCSMDGVTELAIDAEGLKGIILSRDIVSKNGIKLSKDKEGNLTLDVYIRVKYETIIPQLAWELQKKIQEDVNNKDGVMVNDINIHVEGVDLGE